MGLPFRCFAGLAVGLVRLMASDPGSNAESFRTGAPPRATVFAVQDSSATALFIPNPEVVRHLVDRGVAALAGRPSASEAWRSLLPPGDSIGFKVTSAPGEVAGTRLAVVRALVESLQASGHPSSRIAIWDKRPSDLRRAGWYRLADELGVRCIAAEDAGWDPDPFKAYEKPVLGRLVAGDLEFPNKEDPGAGRRSFVSRLLSQELNHIVPVSPVLNHNVAGVNGQLLGLAYASVDNTLRFVNNPGLLAETVPEICALDDVLPKVLFGVTDALICQYRGEDTTRLHQAIALNELRFSRDPVALDVLAIADIERARGGSPDAQIPENRIRTELFANAELLDLGVADLKRIELVRPSH
ncbi:MAG: hypothetical protein KF791_08665 [Verrucomicrobiae bacterium]|nr:hypothetical protein [Verrucomicrobiae bacterium]